LPGEDDKTGTSAGVIPQEKEGVMTREATVEDIERIESLTLEDFAADLSKVQLPGREGPLSEGELKLAVDTFLNSLERQ
jgi:hypothetical protein